MKTKLLYFGFFLFAFSLIAQQKSNLVSGKRWQHIHFKFINNLIILPLEINGVQGDFILDTGVRGNIIFLGENQNFHINDSLKEVKLRGFGYGDPIPAFVSVGNTISYKRMELKNKNFFLLKDEKLNFSAKTGIAIHGLIGSDFFRNNVVKIDYKSKKLTVYDRSYFYKKKFKEDKVKSVPLVFHNEKPYLQGKVQIHESDSTDVPVKLLIDTGGTDALWLFKDASKFQTLPPKYFTDFLGESLTGSLHGDKSRIENFEFGGYSFGNPIVSFLNEDVAERAKKIKGRSGTVGAGILKRFTVWFDYRLQKMYLKKNSDYRDAFYYNMSGLEINYNGSVMVLEFLQNGRTTLENGQTISLGYYFALKPSYVIANVRKGSPGDLGGLKEGDVLLEIDGIPVHEKSYADIIEHFYEKKNKNVDLLIERNDEELLFEFQLVDELD